MIKHDLFPDGTCYENNNWRDCIVPVPKEQDYNKALLFHLWDIAKHKATAYYVCNR